MAPDDAQLPRQQAHEFLEAAVPTEDYVRWYWPVSEGRLLVRDLIDHATQPQFVYRHSGRMIS